MFDDPNLVSCAGLAPVLGLDERAGLHELVAGIAVLTGHTDVVGSVAFSRNGEILASGSDDNTVRLWSVATGRGSGRPLSVSGGQVHLVAFSPDGKTLATGDDHGVRLWSVATATQIGSAFGSGISKSVWSVTFSPDGNTLASGSVDGELWLWDVSTGLQIGDPLTGHTGSVESVAFGPDGKTLASGSADHTVRLWNVGDSRQVGTSLSGETLANGNSVDRRPSTVARLRRWSSAWMARP